MCFRRTKCVLLAVFNPLLMLLFQNLQGENQFIKIVVEIKHGREDTVQKALEKHNFYYLRKVTKTTYTFIKENASASSDAEVAILQHELLDKIDYIVQSQELFLQLSPTLEENLAKRTSKADVNLIMCSPKFDPLLGIDATWDHGFTGRDVVVAVVDIGIDPDQPDLKENIDLELSHNFVDNSNDFRPETFPQILLATDYTNHGNACAGLVAGQRNNSACQYCGSGVAPKATISALKVCRVQEQRNGNLKLQMDDETLSQALRYRNDEIDIYSCSMNHNKPFQKVRPYMQDVLREGYTNGRKGKGSVFVYPADPPGNGYTNNIYTIGVGSIGVQGGLSAKSQPNSAVLVSVFAFGRRKNDTHLLTLMHTAFIENKGIKCELNFGGSSAATAIISGMIALALEANPELTTRDIKHLLVESSDHIELTETSLFKKNGAGHHYHDVFGFGYPVARTMITLARSWKKLPELLSNIYLYSGHQECLTRLNVGCDGTSDCIEKTEQVLVNVTFVHLPDQTASIVVVSPSGTRSVLFEGIISPDDLSYAAVSANFLTNHFWGEDPNGTWSISLASEACNNTEECFIYTWNVTVYGTGRVYGTVNLSTELKANNKETKSRLEREQINVPEVTSLDQDSTYSSSIFTKLDSPCSRAVYLICALSVFAGLILLALVLRNIKYCA